MLLLLLNNFETPKTWEKMPGFRKNGTLKKPSDVVVGCSLFAGKINPEVEEMKHIASRHSESEQRKFSDGGGLTTHCPECGASLVFEEGCVKCYSCGYGACNGGGH